MLKAVSAALAEWPYIKYDVVYFFGTKVFPSLMLCGYYLLFPFSKQFAYKLLLAAHRGAYGEQVARLIRKKLSDIAEMISPREKRKIEIGDRALVRLIVLKEPKPQCNTPAAKGVVLIKFTETFREVLSELDCEGILNRFHVILEPSWSGYALEEILAWTKFSTHRIYVQAAEEKDFQFIEGLQSNLVPVRTGSGDWVDYRVFFPGLSEKIFDVVCVANYMPIKRLHVLLRAAYKLKRAKKKVSFLIICSTWGSCRENVLRLMEIYGLQDSVKILENLPQADLARCVSNAKLNVLLSLREGSNRSLYEGFFVNTPGLLLQENHGVNKLNFEGSAGILIPEEDLEQALANVDALVSGLHPRSWAMENLAPEITLGKIVTVICKDQNIDELSYREGLYEKVNSPEASYMFPENGMTKERSDQLIIDSMMLQPK